VIFTTKPSFLVFKCVTPLIAVLIWVEPALACPDGQVNQCIGPACACVPDVNRSDLGKLGNQLNPLPDVITILGAATKANVQQLNQAVGSLIAKSTCIGCVELGNNLLSKPDVAFLETVVGRGFIVYVATDDPIMVLADAAASAAAEYRLTHNRGAPTFPKPVPPAKRDKKKYEAQNALCAAGTVAMVTLAAVDQFVLVDSATGTRYTMPQVDLLPGDIVTFKNVPNLSPDCGAPDKQPKGQSLVSSGQIMFDQIDEVAGPPGQIHFTLLGNAGNVR
jgi:hypothetical protein